MNINFTPENSALATLENGKNVFFVNRKDENGVYFRKEIQTPTLVSALHTMETLAYASKVSSKGLAIVIGNIDLESIKKEGFKTVSDFVKSADFGSVLDSNTINRYRRVGKTCGIQSMDESGNLKFSWYGFAQDVSVTNICAVLPLMNLPEKFENATIDELHKCVDAFITEYVDTEKLHLSAPLATLRKEIKDLSAIVATITPEEVASEEVASEEVASEEVASEEVASEENNAIIHIDALRIAFKGNKKALDLLAKLASMIEN